MVATLSINLWCLDGQKRQVGPPGQHRIDTYNWSKPRCHDRICLPAAVGRGGVGRITTHGTFLNLVTPVDVHLNIRGVTLRVLAAIAVWALTLGVACGASDDSMTRMRTSPTPVPWIFEWDTPLHRAAYDGEPEVVEELLNQGVIGGVKVCHAGGIDL